ncbi:MAG: hypothetical protein EZS26_000672 [Candidatus Ordinivivax streblomastigis]|jgi:hypothetical protein|uniref:Uncharacterized protein n=1 Tax=Candidatus Ordinivivax streblomastigis TaxID=2540710 RepID=A0A5M8P3L6_9BACT|nr:MAG: hypothetical protein EZS26_000672 [Candidatus Ordinivivax streblomastigis]
MGYIREPEGIDFIINGKPLTDKEKQAISEFIKADKMKNRSKKRIAQTIRIGQELYV